MTRLILLVLWFALVGVAWGERHVDAPPLSLQAAPDPCRAELHAAVRWLLEQVDASSSIRMIHPIVDYRTEAQKLRARADEMERQDADLARIRAMAQRCVPEEKP